MNVEEYPLEHKWFLWCDQYPGPNKTPEEYAKALKRLSSFKDIRAMWRLINWFPLSLLLLRNSYYMMKEDITPLWEDVNNQKGMTINIHIPNDRTIRYDVTVVALWSKLIALVVGEKLSFTDDINGIGISRRKSGFVLNIWSKSADQKLIEKIESEILPILQKSTIIKLDTSKRLHNLNN